MPPTISCSPTRRRRLRLLLPSAPVSSSAARRRWRRACASATWSRRSRWSPRLQAEVWATVCAAAPSLLDLATRWIEDGTAQDLVEAKRREAARRQQLACSILGGLSWVSHPYSSHLWLELPPPWRVEPFLEQARRRGVAVNPAAAFAADPAAAPAAVRVCLGPVADRGRLAGALSTLAEILAAPAPPEDPVV